jgi:alanyl-tRNA synthetase
MFLEKYGDDVRVVIIDDKYSVELCGTHVKSTNRYRAFKIVKKKYIFGTRRIFARTGEGIAAD